MKPKSGRDLEPERMVNAGPKQRRAARWFLNHLGRLFGDEPYYDTKSGGSE